MRILLLTFLLAALFSGNAAEPTRAEFAHAMSAVTEGMKAADVVKLLGKPDDIRTEYDPGASLSPNQEQWAYGTSGHLSFPTLGAITLASGTVEWIFGGHGTPPDSTMFNEAGLRKLLRLIDSTSGATLQDPLGGPDNPLRLIQCANALLPLGKEKALAAIREYIRVEPFDFDNPHLFLIMRLLFEVPPKPGYLPQPALGAPMVRNPSDKKRVPLFPMVLIDDIPLNLVSGYSLAGMPEPPEMEVDYFQKSGIFRTRLLAPTNDPLSVLEMLQHSRQWIYPGKPGSTEYDSNLAFLGGQLVRLIDTVYRTDPDQLMTPCPACTFDWKHWNKIINDVNALHIRWDAAKSFYVRGDGTSLPEVPPKIYRRQIWHLSRMGSEGELILERQDEKTIDVSFHYNQDSGVALPKATLRLYRTGVSSTQLAVFHVKYSGAGEGSTSTQDSDTADLPTGQSCQAKIIFARDSSTSPVFTP